MAKILGLDVGDATIGVAVSDSFGWTAQGIMTIRRQNVNSDLLVLRKLIQRHEIIEVVVGMPLRMNGQADQQTQKTLRFTQLLRNTFDIPITLWDERFSTIAASKALASGHVKKRQKTALIDKVAAVIILQGYLDRRNTARTAELCGQPL